MKKNDVLWAKTSDDPSSSKWLPISVHSFDTMYVSTHLWEEWVPRHTREIIESGIQDNRLGAIDLLKFLSASHDIGKAIPAFQRQKLKNQHMHDYFIRNLISVNLPCNNAIADSNAIHHSLASELILERNGVRRSISSIVGAHHGNTQKSNDLNIEMINAYVNNTGFNSKEWKEAQDSLLSYVYQISGVDAQIIVDIDVTIWSQILLSALIILSDWIASNENWFPLIDEGVDISDNALYSRGEMGWAKVRIPPVWNVRLGEISELFENRFGISNPHPFQRTLIDCIRHTKTPGIYIVEAPMGEGKTEASLAASEILSEKFGMGGVLFALPTQATADGMFPRMKKWIDSVTVEPNDINSIFLAHGKSKFNDRYTSITHYGWENNNLNGDRTVIHEWFNGKKKGLLSDFAVGTVDNVLMGGLKLKHLALRHLALTNKVVIIDECHAYDSYMGSYLTKITSWLGMYKVPIIILSATLYPSRREELIRSYLGDKSPNNGDDEWISSEQYPCITYTDDNMVKQIGCDPSLPSKEILIEKILYSELLPCIEDASKNGGYIGIVCNTVAKAQDIYEKISEDYPDDLICLLHSRYTCIDRTEKESEVLSLMSKECRREPPFRMFVIGTQVIEQSLDLDFDVLITELCPIDLLFQRIGRLHRHNNVRPKGLELPKCYVMDDGELFDQGTEYVYGRYQLYNTRILLKDKLSVPSDIPRMVHAAYSDEPIQNGLHRCQDYLESFEEMKKARKQKEEKASVFQICNPYAPGLLKKGMTDWLKNRATDDPSGNRALATVRDTNGSVETVLVKDNGDGTISPISGDIEIKINVGDPIDEGVAFILAGCKVSLPNRFVSDRMISKTLCELSDMTNKAIPRSWVSNGWLKDELFLVSDVNGNVKLNGINMKYSSKEGLVIIDG